MLCLQTLNAGAVKKIKIKFKRMSIKWTFSPSSLPYLEKCIAAAPPPDLNNKWFQKFGKKESPVASVENDDKIIEIVEIESNNTTTIDKATPVNYEDIFDTIESESTFPVEYVLQECAKNPELISKLAEKLSTNSVEQLFKSIFSEKKEVEILPTFITKFMPIYKKLQYSRVCVDIMVKLHENYPLIFKELLQILINDIEIPNQVLINYTAALNEQSATDFIKTLIHTEISSDGFSQNVLMLYTAYKECAKDDLIQNYIRKLIILHSSHCVSDRNFGRLFLTFLHIEKEMGRNENMQQLAECLEEHTSPFKRPCSMLLKEINLN